MVRRLRLWSGLALFAFVLTHFLNHALGLASLEALEWGSRWFVASFAALLLATLIARVLRDSWRRRHGLVSLTYPAGRVATVVVGPVIVGEMGYGRAVSVTAIGDAVNTASRLEASTKELAAELVISKAVASAAGLDAASFALQEIELRGRAEPLAVYVVSDAKSLAP